MWFCKSKPKETRLEKFIRKWGKENTYLKNSVEIECPDNEKAMREISFWIANNTKLLNENAFCSETGERLFWCIKAMPLKPFNTSSGEPSKFETYAISNCCNGISCLCSLYYRAHTLSNNGKLFCPYECKKSKK